MSWDPFVFDTPVNILHTLSYSNSMARSSKSMVASKVQVLQWAGKGHYQLSSNQKSDVGFAYTGSLGHFPHILLDKLFKGKKDSKTIAKEVLLNLKSLTKLTI